MRTTAKRNRRGGYTLVELLMVMLILSLAGSVILGGMPAAVDVYVRTIDFSNAQVLLATTMTHLRDEIGTARKVEIPDGGRVINYTESNGNRLSIFYYDGNSSIENIIRELAGEEAVPEDEESGGGEDGTNSEQPYQKGLYQVYLTGAAEKVFFPLSSNGTAPQNLYTNYDSVTFDSGEGILTISNLRVDKASETLASADEFKIRVLTCIR